MKYYQRTGRTNDKFTRGRFYKTAENEAYNCIVNDKGGRSYIRNGLENYWVEVNRYDYDYDCSHFPQEPVLNAKNEKEINKMLEIKNVILINNQDSEQTTIEDLIHLIEQEEMRIERLDKIKSESKAITKLKTKHTKNIKDLHMILDSKI